jgi:hypothetical protein
LRYVTNVRSMKSVIRVAINKTELEAQIKKGIQKIKLITIVKAIILLRIDK